MSICEKDLALVPPPSPSTSRSWSAELLCLVRSRLPSAPFIPTGVDRQGLIDANRDRILEILEASPAQWSDWRWQATHKVESVHVLREVLNLDDSQASFLLSASRDRPWSITPYYLSLMSPDPNCPIRLQAMPVPLSGAGQEVSTARVSGLKSRSQSVIRVTNECAMKCQYCHFCRIHEGQAQSRDRVRAHLVKVLEYVREHVANREVVVTGGDPLLLDDATLGWLLSELTSMGHVDSVSLETRAPATLPQRVTAELATALSGYPSVTIATHINSPLEVSRESVEALSMLHAAGVALENQAVHLRGVNDKRYTMKRLNDVLRQVGFSPARKYRAI